MPTAAPPPLPRNAAIPVCREYSAALTFAQGPFSYLAYQLNATGEPTLLWCADGSEDSSATAAAPGRDRLPPGFTEASLIVAPAASEADDLFYYWSATAPPAPPPPSPPSPPPPAPGTADLLLTQSPNATAPPSPPNILDAISAEFVSTPV